MNIEQLSKSQLILLALLVSFVSSVATGIVTVTLMEQAPPTVTQTVNRIVERTVETVIPEKDGEVAGAATVTETVVVRESDLIASAVAAAEPSIVRLFQTQDQGGSPVDAFVGMAIVISDKGELVADAATPDGPLKALRSDGTTVTVAILTRKDGQKVVRIQAPLMHEGKSISWQPAKFIATLPTPGQAVVAIGGTRSSRLGGGIVIGTTGAGSAGAVVETNIALSSFGPGSPLLTADGIVGLATQGTRTDMSGFLASSAFLLDNASSGQGAADQ